MGLYRRYWWETRVPISVVWRVGRVVMSHGLNSAELGVEDIPEQFWWSDKATERRGLMLPLDGPKQAVISIVH